MVTFNYLIKAGKPQGISNIKKLVLDVFVREKATLSCINYVFCTDDYLLGINKDYLSHNYYTDIITFRLSNAKEPIMADVFISTERVKDNARQFGVPYQEELRRVILHGALHLCGYNDKTKAQARIMREKENEYLGRY